METYCFICSWEMKFDAIGCFHNFLHNVSCECLTVIMNGLRGVCEAAAGGGTTVALPVSSLNDSLYSEEVDTLIKEDEEELDDGDMDLNRMQSNDPKLLNH